jgi:hypothetical protein
LYAIDVFNDYLTFGGHTSDYLLQGLSTAIYNRIPYIALTSISKSNKIYWAKGFSSKVDHEFNGL